MPEAEAPSMFGERPAEAVVDEEVAERAGAQVKFNDALTKGM